MTIILSLVFISFSEIVGMLLFRMWEIQHSRVATKGYSEKIGTTQFLCKVKKKFGDYLVHDFHPRVMYYMKAFLLALFVFLRDFYRENKYTKMMRDKIYGRGVRGKHGAASVYLRDITDYKETELKNENKKEKKEK